MKENKNSEYYDVTAHLIEKFGPIGSESWKAEEDRAWEEYNADILHDARKKAGLTQEEFALRSGLGLRFVRDLEQGKETVRMDKVNQALAMFGMVAVPGEIRQTGDITSAEREKYLFRMYMPAGYPRQMKGMNLSMILNTLHPVKQKP